MALEVQKWGKKIANKRKGARSMGMIGACKEARGKGNGSREMGREKSNGRRKGLSAEKGLPQDDIVEVRNQSFTTRGSRIKG